MKRTVELDTLAICDRLNDSKRLAAAIAVGLDGVRRIHCCDHAARCEGPGLVLRTYG
jgi:hypothetical protein